MHPSMVCIQSNLEIKILFKVIFFEKVFRASNRSDPNVFVLSDLGQFYFQNLSAYDIVV